MSRTEVGRGRDFGLRKLARLGARLAAAFALAVALPGPVHATDEAAPRRFEYRKIGTHVLSAYVFTSAGAPGQVPAILLFHGGGWRSGSPEWTFSAARRFAALGLVAIAVEYRLSSDKVTPIDAVADTCAAFAWVGDHARRLHIDRTKLIGYGVSAGGHLVASAATIGCPSADDSGRAPSIPAALILSSPALDMTADRWFAKLLQQRADASAYSPLEHVGARTPPTLIVQGEEDTLTRAAGARAFCERMQSFGRLCEIALYPGVGHLLTRNLANQESDFDPDPVAADDAIKRQHRFLAERNFVNLPFSSDSTKP